MKLLDRQIEMMCAFFILFFGIIAFKGYQINGDPKLILGFSGLSLIHLLALIFIIRHKAGK